MNAAMPTFVPPNDVACLICATGFWAFVGLLVFILANLPPRKRLP